jgi:ribonuclease-3
MHISNERMDQLKEFQEKYNLEFSNIELLNQAFIHSSYVRENDLDVSLCYEKLEFYGDAVLKLAISDFLYNHFKDFQEGELTNARAEIVSDSHIFEYAKELGFQELIILGKNERKQKGYQKESILACAFEALLGAIFIEYKENGYKKAREFLKDNFIDDILSIDKKMLLTNPKALLQEYTQGIDKKLPEYVVTKELGEAHNKTFYVDVIYNNKIIGQGIAQSIKKAEKEAAYNALKKLNLIKENK